MRLTITINGQEHTLELVRGGKLSCKLDGASFEAEGVEVQPGVYSLLLGGRSFQVRVAPNSADAAGSAGSVAAQAGHYQVQIDGTSYRVAVRDPRRRTRGGDTLALEGKQNVAAPMPGRVVRILVAENQAVEAGQGLIVVEAMKMQNEIRCTKSGSVQKVLVREGQAVNSGQTLLVVE